MGMGMQMCWPLKKESGGESAKRVAARRGGAAWFAGWCVLAGLIVSARAVRVDFRVIKAGAGDGDRRVGMLTKGGLVKGRGCGAVDGGGGDVGERVVDEEEGLWSSRYKVGRM